MCGVLILLILQLLFIKPLKNFCRQVQDSLKERNITAPVHVLKADGGTLPLDIALKQPVETIFTGPAASVLGIEALGAPQVKSISLDVGGTTTVIAFGKMDCLASQTWELKLPAIRQLYVRSICEALALAVIAVSVGQKPVLRLALNVLVRRWQWEAVNRLCQML